MSISHVLMRQSARVQTAFHDVGQNRVRTIDGLRGLLGLSVFVHHAALSWNSVHIGAWLLLDWRLLMHAGESSVALFFMITAYLFWGRILERRQNMNWPRLLISRVFRLYPVYLVMLGLVILAVTVSVWLNGSSGPVWEPLFVWLTMAGTPDIHGVSAWRIVAGVTWTLRHEWFFYALLPVMGVIVAGRSGLVAAIVGAVIVALLSGLLELNEQPMISFLGGIAAAHVARRPNLTKNARGWQAAVVALLALLSVFVFCDSGYGVEPTLLWTVFFIIVCSGNDLWGLLRQSSLVWLGEISYSIYLFHGIFLWMTVEFAGEFVSQHAGMAVLTVIALDVCLVLTASLAYLLVERPGILLGRQLQKRVPLRSSFVTR